MLLKLKHQVTIRHFSSHRLYRSLSPGHLGPAVSIRQKALNTCRVSSANKRVLSHTRCRARWWKDAIVSGRFCHPFRQKSDFIYFLRLLPRVCILHFLLRTPLNSIMSFLFATIYKPECSGSLSFSHLVFSLESQLEIERYLNYMDASKITDDNICWRLVNVLIL